MSNGTRHRFFVPGDYDASGQIELPEYVSQQVQRVLRLRTGDRITIFDGAGAETEATIVRTEKRRVTVETSGEVGNGIVPGPPRIALGQAMLKSDRFDLVVQKTTELGVASITAIENERCVVSLQADRARSRLERWQRIGIEALEQSERADMVSVDGPIAFADYMAGNNSELKLIAAERSDSPTLAELCTPDLQDVTICIGPEGGYTDAELQTAHDAGFVPVSLGPTILRSETAAIASVAMIRALTERGTRAS